MLLATVEQMRTIEDRAVESQNIPLETLMERAGSAVAEVAAEMAAPKGRVAIFCGTGNNGGDGYVAARLLAKKRFQVTVVTLAEPDSITGAAALAWRKIADKGFIAKTRFDPAAPPEEPDLAIDALLGFGLKGPARGPAAEAIKLINSYSCPVLAVDIPSGIDADTGAVGRAVRADRTVTFTCPKAGMALYPGFGYTGAWRIADIGIDKQLVNKYTNTCLGNRAMIRPLIPRRGPDWHKGDCGRVLIVAGSPGMTGAAAMCADAALRSGAGLVTLAVPASLNDILETKLTEVMTLPVPETDKRAFGPSALGPLLAAAAEVDVVALGPGIGTDAKTRELVKNLVVGVEKPLIVDADGLNCLAGGADSLSKRQAPTIITPHPGELSRLIGASTAEIQSDRLGQALKTAAELNAVVILKGARTIAADKTCRYINPTGNPGMATAGTGDILCGMVAGLAAQGLPAFPAALSAVYLHGLAGDFAAADRTELALRATDLLDYFPKAIEAICGKTLSPAQRRLS